MVEVADRLFVLAQSSMGSSSRQEPSIGSGIRREALCESLDRLLKVSLGLVEAAESAQRQSSIGLLVEPMRLCGDRVGEVGDGELVLAEPVSSVSSIVERCNMLRIDLERFVEEVDGVSESTQSNGRHTALEETKRTIKRVLGC